MSVYNYNNLSLEFITASNLSDETDYYISFCYVAICLKIIHHFFDKTNCNVHTSHAISKFHITAMNSDWFFALCALFTIGCILKNTITVNLLVL